MKLRAYQEDAINAVINKYQTGKTTALVVIPTGGGKTPIIAEIVKRCHQKNSRVCILTHRSELIVQNASHIKQFLGDDVSVGIYCDKLNKKDTDADIIVASIQSIGKKHHLFKPFSLMVVDEAHLIPTNPRSLYREFYSNLRLKNPKMLLLGLTATPFRMHSGRIYDNEWSLFDCLDFEISIAELIHKNYLCNIISKQGCREFDVSEVKIKNGEFDTGQLDRAIEQQFDVIAAALDELIRLGKKRKSWILFSNNVENALNIHRYLVNQGIKAESVSGETKKQERKNIIERFKNYESQCIVNCRVLTTGFDAPNVDLIGLLTSTASSALYVQMVGRGTRNHPDKENCLILDYGTNVERHGCIDDVSFDEGNQTTGESPTKKCPECRTIVHTRVHFCPDCNYEFGIGDPEQSAGVSKIEAYDGDLLSTKKSFEVYAFKAEKYINHKGTKSIKLEYVVNVNGNLKRTWEFLSPYASEKAKRVCRSIFYKRYHEWMPNNIDEAVQLINSKPVPKYVMLKTNQRYINVGKVDFY